jgi:hypothetical protein
VILDGYRDRVDVVFQDQAGQGAAGTAGAAHATGDVIVFLDADDLLAPGICARVAAAFAARPDLVMVQWRLAMIDADGRPLERIRPPRLGLLAQGDLRRHVLDVRNYHLQLTSGVAYATRAVQRVMPVALPPGEHGALDLWLGELVPLLGPVGALDDVGGSYRVHGSSLSSARALDAAWPRRAIGLTLHMHEHVRRVAAEEGLTVAPDARALRDPAMYGWRLWSLRLDPEHHPFPDDRRLALAAGGVNAALRHPHYPWRHRLKRAAWFVAMALAPRSQVDRVLEWYTPDGPRVRAGRVVG